jgi:hypothetical protein
MEQHTEYADASTAVRQPDGRWVVAYLGLATLTDEEMANYRRGAAPIDPPTDLPCDTRLMLEGPYYCEMGAHHGQHGLQVRGVVYMTDDQRAAFEAGPRELLVIVKGAVGMPEPEDGDSQ